MIAMDIYPARVMDWNVHSRIDDRLARLPSDKRSNSHNYSMEFLIHPIEMATSIFDFNPDTAP